MHTAELMRAYRHTALTPVACLLACIGCAAQQKNGWEQTPRVEWNQVGGKTNEPKSTGYHVLSPSTTQGIFPANIGVTRVTMEQIDELSPATPPHLVTNPRNESLLWNAAMDDQMAISEVFPVRQRDMGGAPATPENIVSAMHALGASLGLIYAVNEVADNRTEMFGMLYETSTLKPLATFRTEAEELAPDQVEKPDEIWRTDSRAIAQRQFEAQLRSCMREMIDRDNPAEVEAPEGWVPENPIRTVVWPPPPPYAFQRAHGR